MANLDDTKWAIHSQVTNVPYQFNNMIPKMMSDRKEQIDVWKAYILSA